MRSPDKFWNPYLAGIALGLVVLAAYVVMGRGIGASGASYRVGVAMVNAVAPAHVAATPAMASATAHGNPLDDWLVFEMLGVLIGALVASYTAGRLKLDILKGPRISSGARLGLALGGGVLMGMAARMGRGCTSGQALSGGALLSAGSWAFMLAIFAGGYATAWFVRREWR